MAQAWKCAGLRWPSAEGPALIWDGARPSPLTWGKRVSFGVVAGGVRQCVGARGHPCPVRAAVPGRSTGARCEECARLDRAHSVAADGIADDPRPYRVYLAWFGPGLVKVGITAAERGPVRLLEQGAVCFSWLGIGPLMAARRTEELLRAALRVPDRVPYAVKRAVRSALPAGEEERAGELREVYGRAVRLSGWPESLEREPFQPVDHVRAFGLAEAPAALGEVSELVPGGSASGELVAAAGPDLHLAVDLPSAARPPSVARPRSVAELASAADPRPAGRRGVVVLDTRLMRGWRLVPPGGDEVSFPVRQFRVAEHRQDGLF
ncbi:DUF2797 domain-containing protein [Streptomyces sp. FL07-04A]|uniref:DUF2797 domain-containing protein n=1 Tax=Streptomyces sp. FL07-04A TaxID=3028658 RepID=UPI0029B2FC99|nr:DUF2797 domain-containing protein [Streptomyces sp. FL07-04A]MDX3578374.1 DUF2797 domain-containing protein [Streptomyces sp. FL07-04A]